MNKKTSLNTLKKSNYDSLADSLLNDDDESAGGKNIRWTPPASPNDWKRLDKKLARVDDNEQTTPLTADAEKWPDAWNDLSDDESIDEEETNSRNSSWKSKTEKYTSRNSFVFRRGGGKSLKDTQSVFSVTQLFEYVFLTIVAVILMLTFGLSGVGFHNIQPACEGDNHAPICDLQVRTKSSVHQSSFIKRFRFFYQILSNVISHRSYQITLKNGATQYQVLSAFILGGFVLSSVDMWRKRRSAYGDLCNATRNLIMNLAAIVSQKDISEKCIMIRWSILAYELCVLKARNCVDTGDALEYLQALNLVEEDEWDMLIQGNQNSTVYWWILTKIQSLIDEENLSPVSVNIFAEAITTCRTKGNDLMARIDRDQPRPYCFICAILVNLNLLLTSLSKGLEWAILLHDSQGKIFLEPVLYVEIFVLFTFNAILAMLFDLCSALYNPYGPRSIDLPHVSTSKDIRKFAKEVSTGNKTPHTMYKKHSTRRHSFVLDYEDSTRLEQLEQKLSKTNRVLGRSMLLRPGKAVVMKKKTEERFGTMSVGSFDEICPA